MRDNYCGAVVAVGRNTFDCTVKYAHYVRACRRHKVNSFVCCPVSVRRIVDKFCIRIGLTESVFCNRVCHNEFLRLFDVGIGIVIVVLIVIVSIVVIDIPGIDISRLCGFKGFFAVITHHYRNGYHRCYRKNTYNHKDNVYVLFEKLRYSLSCLRRRTASFSFVFGLVLFFCHFYLR